MKIKIKAPAKINLTLDVLGKRPDNYHEVSTIMQAIDLYDIVTISDNDSNTVTLSCNYPDVPCDDRNICAKAAYRFFKYCNMDVQGVHIDINKIIPTQAGLAGGSTDGAAVIVGLNAMFDTDLKFSDMEKIAEKVGADVPFCLEGGTQLATGIGTTLQKLPSFNCEYVVICKPDSVSVSTANAYQKVDALSPHTPSTEKMLQALDSKNLESISSAIFNDFEVALAIPEVMNIKKIMLDSNAIGAGMSGSGSAVYALFDSETSADNCVKELKTIYPDTFLCKCVPNGCIID